jgi:acyl carrier protein
VPSDDLIDQICTLVARTLDLPRNQLPVTPDTRLDVDSVDALRLLSALEERFDVMIDDGELTPDMFERVGSLATLVLRSR